MTDIEKKAAEAARDYVATRKFTHLDAEVEHIAREVAFVAFLDGALWQRSADTQQLGEKK